jgi:RNA polymerase sigma-B factor
MTKPREPKFARLTNEGLIKLLRRSAQEEMSPSDRSLLQEEIVKRNIGLVKSIALEFRNSGEPIDDLVQAGYIGLLNAVANFDLSRNTRFSTYATYLIKGEIRHYIRDRHSTIRIPQWVQAVNQRLKEEEEAIFQAQGRPPTLAELAQRLGLSEEQLVELLRGRETMTYVSIDEERRSGDPNPDLSDIADMRSSKDDLSFDVRMRILVVIEQLADIERRVIEGLFYQGKSQAEVGRELGVSQRQISRLKETIMDEMKRRLADPAHEPTEP